MHTMHRTQERIRRRGDIGINTLKYFEVENSNLLDFISYQKYIKGCVVFQVGSLFLTQDFMQRIFPIFRLSLKTYCSKS